MWNKRFADAGEAFVFGEAPNHFVEAEASALPAGASVLSVADGEGRNSVFLAGRGHPVHAVEFSPVAIAKARGLAARRGVDVRFEEADLFAWDWPEAAYDVALAVFIQFATPAQRVTLFARLAAAVRPGGLLLIHGYTPEQVAYGTGGPPCAEHMYTEPLMRACFAGLEILRLEAYEREIDEGPGHRGRSALIDFVARRPA
ncbi:MAG: class I SAM-dependent methyltransferase [Rhodocyclaceae bacterium]|nr:class I SAM-dependent methyltransferase [Rhodocyclaceae bacterium]